MTPGSQPLDPEESVARGKALDIYQSGPVEGFGTTLAAYATNHAAVGAEAIVMADAVSGAEHAGEAGLYIVRQLQAAGASAPFVFAGVSQRELMMRSIVEIRVASARVVGSAPMALASSETPLMLSPPSSSTVPVGVSPPPELCSST